MRSFIDDDSGYLDWLAANADGFVVNASRNELAAYGVLHRARCATIGGTPTRGSRWTRDYVKHCGERDELEAFARGQGGAQPRRCGLCLHTADAHHESTARSGSLAAVFTAERPVRRAFDPVYGPAGQLPSAAAAGPGTPQAVGPPAVFAIPSGDAVQLPVAPRLASWNVAGDPDQVRLEAFLAAEELLRPQCERLPGPLALRLDVGLPLAVPLLDQHDLDNYLFPLGARVNRLAAGWPVSVWGTKRHARVSFARLEPATPTQPDKAPDFRHTVWTNKAGQSTALKEQIHDQLTGAVMLPPGPVRMQLSFTVGPRRNWLNLWKPAIDALDRILGRTRPDRPWHPRDGRIVELGLHCSVDPALGNEVCISIAANAWL